MDSVHYFYCKIKTTTSVETMKHAYENYHNDDFAIIIKYGENHYTSKFYNVKPSDISINDITLDITPNIPGKWLKYGSFSVPK